MRQVLDYVGVFLIGGLFAVGLGLAGMTQADKVTGFLTPFGDWDPSLALVMGGAVVVHALTWRVATSLPHPVFSLEYRIPRVNDIDGRLVGGAALFGVGWGLGGYCPGPGIASAVSGAVAPLVFVGTMLVGMGIHAMYTRMSGSSEREVAPLVAEQRPTL